MLYNVEEMAVNQQTRPALGATWTPAATPGIIASYDRPVAFYALSCVIPWALWLGAAYLSHLPAQTGPVRASTAALGLAGLAAPAAVAWSLIRRRAALRADLLPRLLWSREIRPAYLACAALLPLASLFAAQAVSVLLGYSPDQFLLRGGFTFTSGLLPVWLILVLAPILEELAWHSYGTDALVARMPLLTASLVFTVIWTFWHVPLALIQGYYQAELVQQGWLQVLNFPVSMVAFVLLMNWLYYKTGRSVLIAIVFHAACNITNEVFLTHPDSKLIQSVLLLLVAAGLVVRDRELFLGRPRPDGADGPGAAKVSA